MKKVLGVLAAALAVILAALGWLGVLSPVSVVEREMGPYQFVYVQDAATDAGRVGELSTALAQRLDAAGITARKPTQEYYASGRGLQNQVGFLVEQSVGQEVLGTDTYFRPIPAQRYMVVTFPFRMQLSYVLATMRAAPALDAHRKQQKYGDASTMVILDGDRLFYLVPIAPA